MHEMSLAMSLLAMAEEEARKAGCRHLQAVTVHYGQLAGVMPEALELAFHALTAEGSHGGVRLNLVCMPLRLRCWRCQTVFGSEEAQNQCIPCPCCGEEFGHKVEQGTELILARVEAAP